MDLLALTAAESHLKLNLHQFPKAHKVSIKEPNIKIDEVIGMRQLFKQFFFMATCLAATVTAEETISDKATGKSFPIDVSYSIQGKEYQLNATGVSTRTKFFVKVYSVAHYIQEGADINKNNVFSQLFNDALAKQLSFVWVRDIDSKTHQDGYIDTFKKVFTPAQQQAMQPQIDQFIGFFDQNMKVNDHQVIRWAPGGIIQVEINGVKKGEIVSTDFAKAVWNIWLGAKSVVNRNQLISLITK